MAARRGFTLMEVLIALAITGMLMTTVMQTLDGTRRAVDTIHNIIENENTGPRILEQMREDLSRLAVHDVADYRLLKGENDNIFGMAADKIDFLVYAPGKIPFRPVGADEPVRASLNEVGYRLRQNPVREDFLELYRREDPLVDDDPFQDGSFTLLYDRVVGLEIQYTEEPELNPAWKDSWESETQEALPHAIEVFLEVEVQPRRSLESLGIIGQNTRRLSYPDVFTIPTESRWRFRNRIHPQRVDAGEQSGEGNDPNANPGNAGPGNTEQTTGEGRGPTGTQGSGPIESAPGRGG